MNKYILMAAVFIILLMSPVVVAQNEDYTDLVVIGCVLAIGITGVSSAIGLSLAGSAAVAVTAEKPNLFAKCLVLQVLPMTQSIYGLLIAILLMLGIGLLGEGTPAVDAITGKAAILIGLAVGITGISAISQGMVASSSICAIARNPDILARGVIYTVMPETIAIFGLLVGILLMTGLGLL